MPPKHFTNAQLWEMDFASKERAAFLRSLPPPSPARSPRLAPGLPAAGVWMTDVSAMDRRSVKEQLAGRGDWRVAWWTLHCRLHRLFHPHTSLEQAMYAFHRRHHFLTLLRVDLLQDSWQLHRTFRQRGVLAGLRCAWQQALAKEQP